MSKHNLVLALGLLISCAVVRYDTSDCRSRSGRGVESRSSDISLVRERDVTFAEACWALQVTRQLSPEALNAELRGGAPLTGADLSQLTRVTQWLSECKGGDCTRIFTVVTASGYQLFLAGYPGAAVIYHVYPPGIDVF